MSSEDLISVKELASKLKVTDALLKKIIKDFNIETERIQKRIHLKDDSVKTVREILALRASGKKNKEIKQLFEEAMGTKPAKADSSAKSESRKAKTDKTDKPRRSSKSEGSKSKEEKKESSTKRSKASKKDKASKTTSKSQDEEKKDSTDIPEETVAAVALEYENSEEHTLDISSYLDEADDAEEQVSIALQLAEESGADEDEDQVEDLEEFDEDEDEDEELDAAEEVEGIEQKLSPRKIRRRQFSFRYIQRQIANDSKRIHYIKQKLKRARLTAKERMYFEDSLEHRSKLLSGWIHLLRWVKS